MQLGCDGIGMEQASAIHLGAAKSFARPWHHQIQSSNGDRSAAKAAIGHSGILSRNNRRKWVSDAVPDMIDTAVDQRL